MKRKYTKPSFAVERFGLSQSIAADCSAENPANPRSSLGSPTSWTKNTCGWKVGGYVVWASEGSGCNSREGIPIIASPDAMVQGFCYNNPDGNNVIFTSG